MSRHYYAEYAPYGIRTKSEADRAIRFDTREERDAWVAEDPAPEENATRQAITAAQARRMKPAEDEF